MPISTAFFKMGADRYGSSAPFDQGPQVEVQGQVQLLDQFKFLTIFLQRIGLTNRER